MSELQLLRNSERQDFKSCPQKWDWRWNQGLVAATPKQDALWFGTIWHLLWATVFTPPGRDGFERSITKPEEIHQLWDELAKDSYTTISAGKWFAEDDELEFTEAIALGHIMIDNQLKQWGLDPQYEVIMPEQRFSINIRYTEDQVSRWIAEAGVSESSWRKVHGQYIVKMVGTFDLPVRDHADGRDRVWILDWKTTNRRSNLKQANKDDQMGTYIGVSTAFMRHAGLIRNDEAVAGAIWSFARKAKPPDNVDDNGRVRNQPQIKHYKEALMAPVNHGLGESFTEADLKGMKKDELAALAETAGLTVWGDVSKNQGAPLFWREVIVRNKANRLRQMRRIAEDAEVMGLMRNGELPILKSPGDHCNWCPFTDLCDIDEDGGNTQDFIDAVFKYEDPYADHREGAKNSKEIVRFATK